MMQLELPHINVLSKIDMVMDGGLGVLVSEAAARYRSHVLWFRTIRLFHD